MSRKLSIAVVGSGISGLAAAWLLAQRHEVVLYEREKRAGGHSNTVDALEGSRPVPVDTGFIVYNSASYPNLIALFDHLEVPTTATNMGFSVSLQGGRYEYSGSSVSGLVGQPANLLRPGHWRMVSDTLRFFREARADLGRLDCSEVSLGTYLDANRYSQAFVTRHILPMAAAIWSTAPAEVLRFPAAAFVRFFDSHGLLQVRDRPEWRTVVGGSRVYVHKILESFAGRVSLGAPVQAIERARKTVAIHSPRGVQEFDACVIATHADQALALLRDADEAERALLGAFRYTPNRAVLHADARLMPKRRRLWSSWNYLDAQGENGASVSYWMNKLQPLATDRDLFVTLNPASPIRQDLEIAAFDYHHPVFDDRAMAAQRSLWDLQGRRGTWFCGSYFGYGFHEDGLQAGLAAAEDIGGVRRPWTVSNESGRIFLDKQNHRRREVAEWAT